MIPETKAEAHWPSQGSPTRRAYRYSAILAGMLPSHRPSQPLSHTDYLSALEENSVLAHEALHGLDPTAPVPDCPDWPASELRDHISGVLAFWAHQLGQATTVGPDFPDSIREGYRRPILDNARTVIAILEPIGPNGVCWNWSGANMTTGWAARRMAHEIAVHRIDAQRTADPDLVTPIAPQLATDGIDELLDVFVGASDSETSDSDPVLRITTPLAQWTLAIGEKAVPTAREPDLTLEAPADAALLTLWGRVVDVAWQGERAVFDSWRAISTSGF